MIERPNYVPFALGDLMMGRAPKEAARGLMGADGAFHGTPGAFDEALRQSAPVVRSAPAAAEGSTGLATGAAAGGTTGLATGTAVGTAVGTAAGTTTGTATGTATGPAGAAPASASRQLVTAAMLRQPDATGERLPLLPTSNLSYRDYEDPVPLLKQELASMGIDHSTFQFRLYDDVISNVGGSYTNRLLEVDLGGGRKEEYAVEWTLRNPRNTANEISTLMRRPVRNGLVMPLGA